MIAKRFSAAAKTYDQHARPQISLAEALCNTLPTEAPARILELGCGTGQLTQRLAARYPNTPIDAVDLSEIMIDHSRAKFSDLSQINWIHGDAQSWQGNSPYPLIISSAALHWTPCPTKTYQNVAQCLQDDGLFALGMMMRGTMHELWTSRRAVAAEKTAQEPLPTLDELLAQLQSAQLQPTHSEQHTEEILYPDAKTFLRVIHEQGVTGAKLGEDPTPLTRGEILSLIAYYEKHFRRPSGIVATYQTATFLLRKTI